MVTGILDFKGFAKPWIFMTFLGGQKCSKKNTWTCRMDMVRFCSPELSTRAKWSPKKSRNNPGGFSPKNPKLRGYHFFCFSHKLCFQGSAEKAARYFVSKTVNICVNLGFFWNDPPYFFRDFLGDHFARVESSRDQNLTMFIVHFHVFFHFWPAKKVVKIHGFRKPFKTLSPGTLPRL